MIKRSLIKSGSMGIFCVAAVAIFFCSRDYNPFTDPENANVYVTSWTFSDKDSVALFETGTFTMVIAVRDEVDSFVFSIPKNRYWADTVVKRTSPGENLKGGPYSFNVSFFDTGRQTSTLRIFRSNGQILEQKFPVQVYNPLWQEDVSGFFGDTLVLLTMAVPDEKKGVLYHWSLEGNWNGSSVCNRFSTSIPLFSPPRGKGSLWVSDISGKNGSPSFAFSYSLDDTSKPVIRCMNDGMEGDTIFSGDTVFAFRAFIADGGSAEVESCSVNRTAFDFVNRSSSIYTKLFNNLPELTENNSAFPIAVFAIDNLQFSNTVCDTFFVVFSSDGIKSTSVFVNFYLPNSDLVTTTKRSYLIRGTVQNNLGDTMKLSCRVNEQDYPLENRIVGAGEWSWLVPLSTGYNTVTVSAYSLDDRILASAQRTIVYDAKATDTIEPMIWEVSTDGQVIGSQFYTEKKVLPLRIVAFDDGTGIARLLFNRDTLPLDTTFYVWLKSTGALEHGAQGNPFRIVAIDNRDNRQERTIVIYKNSPPSLIGDLGIPEECCAESTYTVRRTLWWDADGDAVELERIKTPANMTIDREGVSWQPVLRPGIDKDTLIIELSDSYEKNHFEWIFSVRRCGWSAVSITFATTEHDFPEVLQAGFDRLNIPLSVNPSEVKMLPHYSATLLDNKTPLLVNDTAGLLIWAPSLADTGYRKLMVTVGDGVHGFDTLFPAIWVVPKNQHPCSLSVRFSGETTPAGVLDLFTHPAPETLYFAIHDQDHPLTETYTVTVSLGSLRSVEVLNRKDFLVAIEPDSSETVEFLTVMVRDRTGESDTVRHIIQYGSSTANITPIAEDPGFPVYCCADSQYAFQIHVFDADSDSVEIIQIHVPAGMTVDNSGLVLWRPLMDSLGDDTLVVRVTDRQDTSDVYRWPVTALDCGNMPPPVRFATTAADFPTLLQAEVDSISFQLTTDEGMGVKPFVFQARIDNGLTVLNDTFGKLFWIPTASDTGVRTMVISVKDRYNRSDTLSPQITVVPRNHLPCSLSYVYSGTTLPSGQLYLHSTTQPESALFVISDDDHPLTERYVVTIDRPRLPTTTQELDGAERSFSVKISHSSYSSSTTDTIVVSVNDSTGTTDTVRLIIRYPIDDPDSIADMTLSLSASSGVTTSHIGNTVSEWSDGSGSPWPWHGDDGITLSQTDRDRMPILVQNAVNAQPALLFDDVTHNGDDGLFSTTLQWADTPFTVFIVFSPRSLVSNDRTALVTTNTIYGFALGITCDGTIGIFNDITSKCCASQECRGTDLHVSPHTWYVAAYQSSLGITVGGNIRVQAWLNGKAASQIVEMTTQANAGMGVGTGSSATYNGSFDGWIASIVLYQRALSDDERFLVERYLGNLYTITVK